MLAPGATWSCRFFAFQGLVNGIGFEATLIVPVARRAMVGAHYPSVARKGGGRSLMISRPVSRNSTTASFPRSRLYPAQLRVCLGIPVSNPAGQPVQNQSHVLVQGRAGVIEGVRDRQQIKGVYF